MKRIICFLTLFSFLLASLVLAGGPAFPHPVYGFITADGEAVKDVSIRITNLGTKVESVSSTNINGFYQVDLGNIDPNYRDGDSVKVSLVFCESKPECSKTVAISGGGNEVSWDMLKSGIPIPSSATVVKYVCWDGSAVDDSAKCPVQPTPEPVKEVVKEVVKEEVEVVKVQCLDGTYVDDGASCPESKSSWLYWVIGILVILFGGAGGWKFYNGKIKHYHKGVIGYHDPNTKHSVAKYKHRTWKESATGCISDVKKIEKGIDLSK